MAGFSVANFDFGQNIENNRIRRQQLAQQAAQANQQAALQARGQDIQAEQAEANRAAQAERENADRAYREEQANATRAEQARQFDIESERKDRAFAAERKDKERTQSWDDALKQQQMEAEDLKFQKWQTEMEEFVAKGQRDREEYEQKVQAQKDLRESALGVVSEGVLLSGDMGGFTPSQTSWFNEEYGTQYDCIGKRDMLTGEEYVDGLIHLVQYQKNKDGQVVFGYLDSNGNVVEDTERKNPNSQPLVLADNTISKEDYNLGISRIKQYAGRLSGTGSGSGSSLSLDDRMALQDQKHDHTMSEIGARGQNQVNVARENGQTRREVAGMNNQSREKIAAGHDQTRLEIADISAALERQGFEVDKAKLAEAIRHNKTTEAATAGRDAETGRHHKATEDAATARTEERTRHNKATEEVQRQRADAQAQRVEDQYELGDRKQTHNENRLENDKAQKEAGRQLMRELAELRARASRAEKNGTATPSRIKEINSELTAYEKIIANGSPAERKKAKEGIAALTSELRGDKATIKSGDNTHDDKTITGYRYNKDRTKRIPVYSDGSQGSVEDVQ